MSRRALIVGTQAVTVGLLVLVVYLTLLRPDDPGTLSGIEAPGGEPPRGQVEAGEKRDRGDERREDKGSGRGGTERTGGGTGGGAAGAAAGPGVPVAGTSPPDEQYDDTVTTLFAKLGFAAPVGDSVPSEVSSASPEGESAAPEGE